MEKMEMSMYGRRNLTKTVNELAVGWAKLTALRTDLLGMCPTACCSLYQAMKVNDVVYGSFYNPVLWWGLSVSHASHCWVESGGRVYDPTFKQFAELCPIYVGPFTEVHEHFSFSKREVEGLEDFILWEDEQKPTQGKINWFLERIFNGDRKVMKSKEKNFKFKRRSMCWK